MQDQLILIDKLEDQLIDHPDASTKQEIHDSSLDETFQRKLNARAEQLANQGFGSKDDVTPQLMINKTELDYVYCDYSDLELELNEWFVHADFEVLQLKNLATNYSQKLNEFSEKFNDDMDNLEVEIEFLRECTNSDNSEAFDAIMYFSMGKFDGCSDASNQIHNIRDNMKVLLSLGVLEKASKIIQDFIDTRISSDIAEENTSFDNTRYFKALTVVYFLVNSIVQCNDSTEFINAREILRDLDLISDITEFITHWQVFANSHYRVRYLILLLWKLVLFEFGDSNMLQACDKFLVKHHNIQNKVDASTSRLVCSPLDYFTFREDLIDKYPLFNHDLVKPDAYDFKEFGKTLDEIKGKSLSTTSSSSSIHEDYNYFMALNSHSSSLSNYIANPRPNRSHTIQSQLPAQTVHIATPVPSPPSTPSEFMSGGEKIRKLYQVNQSMPFIYPVSEDVEVPYAVKEADEILQSSIYNSYSNKRLWEERQKFMIQERGYLNNYEQENIEAENLNEFDYRESELLREYPSKKLEIKSIVRVEEFYATNLNRLGNVVQVLVNAIKSHKIEQNLDIIEKELNSTLSYHQKERSEFEEEKKKKIDKHLVQYLEVLRTKEITAKASSAILILLLKWFKINHVLKYYYLTTLLFDQQICNVVVDFLTETFNNSNQQDMTNEKEVDYERMLYQNQLMNPRIALKQFEFFNNCLQVNLGPQKYKLINTKKLTEFRSETDRNLTNKFIISEFNQTHCFTMANMLNILNKVIIKNYTQRILTVNELKPSEILKMMIMNCNNKYLTMPALKLLKKLIPYQGRKWKSINMDLISLIYMNLKLSLRDNWLSGRDLENDFNISFDQEISLRGLLQFYNTRKYPDKMVSLGYEVTPDFHPNPLDENFEYL